MHFQAITIFHIVCFMIRAEKAKIEQQMSGKEREREIRRIVSNNCKSKPEIN